MEALSNQRLTSFTNFYLSTHKPIKGVPFLSLDIRYPLQKLTFLLPKKLPEQRRKSLSSFLLEEEDEDDHLFI